MYVFLKDLEMRLKYCRCDIKKSYILLERFTIIFIYLFIIFGMYLKYEIDHLNFGSK